MVIFVSVGGILGFFAIFDASNMFYKVVRKFLESSNSTLSTGDNLLIVAYILLAMLGILLDSKNRLYIEYFF